MCNHNIDLEVQFYFITSIMIIINFIHIALFPTVVLCFIAHLQFDITGVVIPFSPGNESGRSIMYHLEMVDRFIRAPQ